MDPSTPSLSEEAVARAIDRLAAVDRDIRRALDQVGYPPSRHRPAGFATLLRIMVGQQLSTKAAAAIWGRLEDACGDAVTIKRFLALDDPAVRGVGFSLRKAAHGRALAEAVASGALDLDALASLPEDEAVAAISALRGFGRWSAEVYLLFALGRADVIPADDLGVQAGMQRLKGLAGRPKRPTVEALAEPWRPWRGCGAVFLWHYYGATTLEDRKPPRRA